MSGSVERFGEEARREAGRWGRTTVRRRMKCGRVNPL